jgi:hypothetical protein
MGPQWGKPFLLASILEKIFSRTSWPILIKFGTNRLCIKGIKVCTNKWPGSLQKGDNHKNEKNTVGSSKNLLKNHKARKLRFT